MRSYCLKCRTNTESVNQKVSETNNSKTMIWSKSTVCGSKKSKFIKKQEAKGILSCLGLKTTLIKVSLLSDILFWIHW